MERKIAVNMVTLHSHNHIEGDIEKGLGAFERGGIEYVEREPRHFWARVPHRHSLRGVILTFSADGTDIVEYSCNCTENYETPPLCRHVVAATLTIQGGVVDSKLSLSKIAETGAVVTTDDTAKAMETGSLDVLATPKVIALMEKAACICLDGALEAGETSVGTEISISHVKAAAVGREVTASAGIKSVFGREVVFDVTVCEGDTVLAKGTHSRKIVDTERFEEKMRKP